MNRKTDEELLLLIATADQAAVAELYDRYSKLVYSAVLRMLRDTDDAEDILQEVFVQVWRKAATYKPELGSPKNWLIRIAHNRAVNLVRSKRTRMKQAEVPLPDADTPQASELTTGDLFVEAASAEEQQYVAEALQKLPKDQSKLLDLAFLQGFSHSEIAEMLEMPLGTVKTRIRSGLLTLRSALKFLQDGEE